MSKTEAALVASRALCVYFIFWAIDNLTLLPYRLHEFSYHSSVLYTNHFARVADWILLSEYVARAVVLFIAAGFFYKCGPRLQAFFLDSQAENQSWSQ
jgi:hypothetical protein